MMRLAHSSGLKKSINAGVVQWSERLFYMENVRGFESLHPHQNILGESMEDSLPVEEDEQEEFLSDDEKHQVKWTQPDFLEYPVYYCITHSQIYYRDCI